MNSLKHTPGPWAYTKRADGNMVIGTQDGDPFGELWGDDDDSLCWPVSANARLISAAPELLEALKALVDIFCPVQDGYSSATVRAWKNAEDAIAKATGGQP